MLILALDTARDQCAAALTRDGVVLAAAAEAMSRGHAERLAPMVRSLAQAAGVRLAAVDRVAVTVGPGSFTGLRVGVAFARGVALAAGARALGFSTLQALAAGRAGLVAAVLRAPEGQVVVQAFRDGAGLFAPRAAAPAAAAADLAALGAGVLVGDRDGLSPPPGWAFAGDGRCDPAALAVLAAAADPAAHPPTPLYLRPPDARPAPPPR